MKVRGDTKTGALFNENGDPLFDYRPLDVAVDVPAELRAASLEGQTAKAISHLLADYEGSREDAAAGMSALLTRPITKSALDACCSEAREEHALSFPRAWALAKHTGDLRLFALAVEDLGHVIIPKRYLAAVEDAMTADAIEELRRRQKRARRTWKGGVR